MTHARRPPGALGARRDRRAFLGLGAGLAAGAGLACHAGAARTRPDPSAHGDEDARLDECFAELVDPRGSVGPINPAEYAARRERLGPLLAAAGFDAFLAEGGATMRYLSGATWSLSERLFALVVLADGSCFWISPAFEVERAQLRVADTGGEVVPWQEHEYPFAPLAAELARRGAERLGLDPSLRHRFADGLARELGPGRVAIATDVVIALRGRKDAHEIELLRRANELTQRAIVAASRCLEPGMSGDEIGRLVTHAQRRLGLEGVWNLALIGPAAAYPHGDAEAAPLRRGDVVLVDTGGSLHGYQSDETRSWVFDAPVPTRVDEVWHVVRDAQRAAYEAVRPGVRCARVDAAARAVIDARGYGPGYRTFTHRLGHGIGLEGHEDPYFDGGSQVELAPGMTLSNEPGIYLYGEFGVRLEDVVAVTADGADHFGSWQKGPKSPE